MAKRRRRGGTWFPNLGTFFEPIEDDQDYGRWGTIGLDTTGASTSLILDLTFDRPAEDEASADPSSPFKQSLSDVIGSEYILRRIVGNVFVGLDQSNVSIAPFGAVVTAGFFVARSADFSDEAGGIAQPIGALDAQEIRENYSPGSLSTIREPWIWRRRWILGNNARSSTLGNTATIGSSFAATNFPSTNALYPGPNGPYLDARTIRKVGNDDRLWFVISARTVGNVWSDPFNPGDQSLPLQVAFSLDYRIFGMLRKARNEGRF